MTSECMVDKSSSLKPAFTYGCSRKDFAGLSYCGRFQEIDLWLAGNFESDPAFICNAIIQGLHDTSTAYKYDSQRCVFPLPDTVIKINRMPRIKDRLRPWRFAPAEYTSHLTVQKAGIPCPKILGAFRCTGPLLASFDGLIIERLAGYRELEADDCDKGAEMACRLYRAGINHPDYMRKNVMTDDASGEIQLIDMEGCVSIAPCCLPSLLMSTQRFIEFNELGFKHPLSRRFTEEVYARSALDAAIPAERFHKAVELLLTRHSSREERRKLLLPDEIRSLLPPGGN